MGANSADLLHSQQTFSYTVYASDLRISQLYPQIEHFTNDEKLTENEIVQNHSLSNAFSSIIIRSNTQTILTEKKMGICKGRFTLREFTRSMHTLVSVLLRSSTLQVDQFVMYKNTDKGF